MIFGLRLDLRVEYSARYLYRWFCTVESSITLKNRLFYDEPISISLSSGDNMLLKNRGYLNVGWMEPFQYNLMIDFKGGGVLVFVDHETLEPKSMDISTFFESME